MTGNPTTLTQWRRIMDYKLRYDDLSRIVIELCRKHEANSVRVIAVDGVPCYEKRGTMDVLEISVRPGSLRRINLPRVRAWAKAEVVS